MRTKVLIAGAAGRDFHNFNVVYRGRDEYDVVGFTATQIPDIAGRVYPALLAGELYPDGIPIRPEAELEELIREHDVDEVVFAYSDVTHEHVMHIASRALAAGASFRLLSPHDTMIASSKPVAAICAVRTGSGKSQTTRRVAQLLREDGRAPAPDAVRRPDETDRPALRALRGSGGRRLHDRGARRVRAAYRRGQPRLRRHRLRGDPRGR
jgi:predicted GTPase